MFSHAKRHYCKFFVYWKSSLEDGTYFAKEDSDETQWIRIELQLRTAAMDYRAPVKRTGLSFAL